MNDLETQQYRRIETLEVQISYAFKDRKLAIMALTHSSYGDGQRNNADNERLEFLGDRVLGLLTAEMLFHHSEAPEGQLARRLNALVRKETCAKVAREIGIGDALLLSASEEKQGGREKTSILGDACESLIAAIYLDGGYGRVKTFYDTYWLPIFADIARKSAKDPKTELQERAMAISSNLPVYKVTERSGPDHQPLFVIEVSVEGVGAARGTGKSKRDAERFAAKHLLDSWNDVSQKL